MVENVIKSKITALDEAYSRNEADAYFSHFTDDVTIMVPGFGRWTKQDYVEKWSGVITRGGGVEASKISDLKIRISPAEDAAVASYILDVTYRGLYPNQPADHREDKRLLMTEVWFLRDSTWKIAHMDWSTVEPH